MVLKSFKAASTEWFSSQLNSVLSLHKIMPTAKSANGNKLSLFITKSHKTSSSSGGSNPENAVNSHAKTSLLSAISSLPKCWHKTGTLFSNRCSTFMHSLSIPSDRLILCRVTQYLEYIFLKTNYRLVFLLCQIQGKIWFSVKEKPLEIFSGRKSTF